MCVGYDPFKWADNYGSEEEYLQELIKEKENEENDKTRSSSSGNTSNADIERQ